MMKIFFPLSHYAVPFPYTLSFFYPYETEQKERLDTRIRNANCQLHRELLNLFGNSACVLRQGKNQPLWYRESILKEQGHNSKQDKKHRKSSQKDLICHAPGAQHSSEVVGDFAAQVIWLQTIEIGNIKRIKYKHCCNLQTVLRAEVLISHSKQRYCN